MRSSTTAIILSAAAWIALSAQMLRGQTLTSPFQPATVGFATTHGTFPELKMWVRGPLDIDLEPVAVTFADEVLLIEGIGKDYRDRVSLPYANVVSAEYGDHSSISLTKALYAGPMALVFRNKKRWFRLNFRIVEGQPDDQFFLMLKNKSAAAFIRAFERATGLRVAMAPPVQ